MAYKSKDKFLEVGGKRWSHCGVDPASGVPCRKHSNHKYALGSSQQLFTDPYMVKYLESLDDKKNDLEDYWGEEIKYTQVKGKPFGITDREMHLENGVVLTQIVATEDIHTNVYVEYADGVIHRGELGGFIEKPEGLIDGWVGNNAFVYGNTILDGGIYVYDTTIRSSTINATGSIIYSTITNSELTGDVEITISDITQTNLKDLKADSNIVTRNVIKSLGEDSTEF